MNCLIFRLTVQNYYSKLLKVVSVKKKMQKKCTFFEKVHFLVNFITFSILLYPCFSFFCNTFGMLALLRL